MTSSPSLWTPREYQQQVLDFLWDTPRGNLHASPGMGKTTTLLTHLVNLSLVDEPFPVLAVGPKRVAVSVWSGEVEKWAHLQGLKVSRIVGTRPQREKALRSHADVYTINYEGLLWLVEELNGQVPFRAVIADESTRIKNHRVSLRTSTTGRRFLRSDGAKNAAALITHIAPKVKFWYNATGTPAPNGLRDLWGQQFPVDWGRALGMSHSAFTTRWFYPTPGSAREHDNWTPFDHAQQSITERLRPTTISLDAYDWFDVDRPRVVDLEVELPPARMKEYRKLHRESVLGLTDGTEITAVNAGARTMKCRQYASGWVLDEDGKTHLIHREKLEMLDSLVENLSGAPLIVVYTFIHEREALLKRYKGAEVLPSDPSKQLDTETRWNEGKIPMLVVHPGAAGHGLNLQHGGHNMCFFSPDWNLEYYQQVIERIGPVRQAQAGYERMVNIYRILTKGTWDINIRTVLEGKASVQDAVRNELGLFS